MINNKRTAIYVGAIIVISSSFAPAEDFLKYTPSTSPIVKIATPKPNIYMLLDDSNSMYVTGNDHAYMSVKEHFYGPGDPVCEMPKGDYKKKWDELVKQYENMEGKYYNPLKTGRYKPYLREVIGDAEYEKYDASIPIERCSTKVYRTEAVIQMVPELLEKYSKRAYLGYGGLGKYQLNDFRGATNINIANTTGIWDGVCQSGACTAYYVELFLAKLRKAGESNRGWNLNAAKSIANQTVKEDARYNVFEQPITDMSEYKPNDWARVKSSIARNIMGEYVNSSNKKNYLLGGTPTFNALYNVSLYFRGYPIVETGFKAPAYVFGDGYRTRYQLSEIEENFSSYSRSLNIRVNNPANSSAPTLAVDNNANGLVKLYGTKTIAPPKRFRCTTNSVIVLTDGDANDSELGIVARKDLSGNGGFLPSKSNEISGWQLQLSGYGGSDLNKMSEYERAVYERESEGTIHFQTNAGYRMARGSSSVYHPNLMAALNKTIAREFTKNSMRDGTYEDKDSAGKHWGEDKFSIGQKLQVNAVQYGQDKFNQYLENLTDETGGQVITLPEDASSTAILSAMEKIMSDLIRSTSNAQMATSQFQQTVNTVRYTFRYNIEAKHGEVIANKVDKENDSGWSEKVLWNSTSSFLPSSGKFITMDYKNSPKSELITMDSVSTGYLRGNKGASYLHRNHIGWLRGEEVYDDINLPIEKRVYRKTSSIGPVVNGEGALFAHDAEYINLHNMDGIVRAQMNQYVLYKNKQLKRDYMVLNANDGMVHFLSIPRASPTIEKELAEGTKSVEHVVGYFPGILAYRLPQLANMNKFSYSIDGVARLFEFKDSKGDIRSVGLSSFGAGGKGFVGYQLFKATPSKDENNMVFSHPDAEIKPLFEISNEGNWRNYGENVKFANLGYTFSDFSFFNQAHPKNSSNGQGVAVLGNGYGTNAKGDSPSSLYFVDIENGHYINEIVLSEHGGGASSPALVVGKSGDYQVLKKIYVGDVSGKLYRVTFNGNTLTEYSVETLYEPLPNQYNPISTKPLVVEEDNNEWVYFGTGRKSDELLDRGQQSPSKHIQYIVGLKNPKQIGGNALTIHELHQNEITPTSLITIGKDRSKKEIQTLGTRSVDSDEEKLALGWYLALSPTAHSGTKGSGEQVVFSPKQSYGDVIFSTWGLDEYDAFGDDPCVEDYVHGKVLILDKKTGLMGTGKIADHKVGGFVITHNTPGIPTGYGIFPARSSGEGYGKSTLDKKTVAVLNKASDSTHALMEKKVCIGNVADDAPNVHGFTVMCPPPKPTDSRRLSYRKMY